MKRERIRFYEVASHYGVHLTAPNGAVDQVSTIPGGIAQINVLQPDFLSVATLKPGLCLVPLITTK